MTVNGAILEANHTRLRPILMTTVMLIAAMVPIALGQGPGAGARASMAKVIIGGQLLSLLSGPPGDAGDLLAASTASAAAAGRRAARRRPWKRRECPRHRSWPRRLRAKGSTSISAA